MSRPEDPDIGSGEKNTKNQEKNAKSGKKSTLNFRWALRVFLISFGISVLLSLVSERATEGLNLLVSVGVLLLFIVLGILFDVIGVSVATAEPARFHAMAAKNVRGSRASLWLISRSDIVSNFCNDVIGDISGVLCGTMSGVIALDFVQRFSWNTTVTVVLTTAFVSAFIVGGKALFKSFALKNSNNIVYRFALVLCFFVPECIFKKKKR